ncbi:methyltransferase domain-containing protein [bacterium]|nr:methyltransferase domain-containing protein [bacterium]
MTQGTSKPYVIDDEDEPKRLEKQARIAGLEDYFHKFPLAPNADVLDAGCGSGAMTRLFAKRVPEGHATGIDINRRYLAFAEQVAAESGIENITFRYGNIFSLPFDDNTFDVVWCKYVLQWVNEPIQAVAEFKRVTRPGGLVVCCHFDGLTHYPVDETWQADADKFINDCIDALVGRKMYWMFHQVGFVDITVDAEPDPIYSVYGAIDEDLRENWGTQLRVGLPVLVKSLGSEERAHEFVHRFLAYQDREDTSSICMLFFVSGRVP